MRSSRLIALQLLVSALCFASTSAMASAFYSGTTNITWSSPVLKGVTIDAMTGAKSAIDNTLYAACNIAGCPTRLSGFSSSTLAWGDYNFDPPAEIPTSSVTFAPTAFANVLPGQVFELGRLTYINGTSIDIIFGATLTLGVKLINDASIVTPIVVRLGIGTTTNTGSDAQNADYLDFLTTTFGTTSPVTFNVLEGKSATAILYGSIVGDPVLTPSSISIAPGSAANGFIGSGVPLAVPEPSLVALLALGAVAYAWRRRQ